MNKMTLEFPHFADFENCSNYIDFVEKTLEKSDYTIYDVDKENKKYPKNIKLETRAYLKEPFKINIHHYRCHIHMIADKNSSNTVNGSNLEISFTLSHRFKAEKGTNRHSHIYLAISYDSVNNKIVYDGYKKKGISAKKILENTNATELADYLLYENYMRMIDENFELIDQPINEKSLFEYCNELKNIRSSRSYKTSFFLLRDNLFWSKLIKFSIDKLFYLLNNIFKIDDESNPVVKFNNVMAKIDKNGFSDIITEIKSKHFPDEISTIPPHNKIKNFCDTRDKILSFEQKFTKFIHNIIKVYNSKFINNQLYNKLKENNKTELLPQEQKLNNIIKILINYIITNYIGVKNNKIINGITSRITYDDVVRKVIQSIYSLKEKIISTKTDSDEKIRSQTIYDILVFIKNKIFVCDLMDELFDEIEELDGIFKSDDKNVIKNTSKDYVEDDKYDDNFEEVNNEDVDNGEEDYYDDYDLKQFSFSNKKKLQHYY